MVRILGLESLMESLVSMMDDLVSLMEVLVSLMESMCSKDVDVGDIMVRS